MKSAEIFSAGYAIPQYDCSRFMRSWRYKDECFELPADAVMLRAVDGVPFFVAKIEDVREAAANHAQPFTVESVYG